MPAPVTIPVDIDGQPHRMVFKFGTVAFFEEATGQNLFSAFPFLALMGADTQDAARKAADLVEWRLWGALFWAVLQPEHRITREGAFDLIDRAGLDQVTAWCMAGLMAYASGDAKIAALLIEEFDKQGKVEESATGEEQPAKKGKKA